MNLTRYLDDEKMPFVFFLKLICFYYYNVSRFKDMTILEFSRLFVVELRTV